MRKGLTPIISIIILLLITISLAGTAWTFLSGVFFSQISKSFIIPTGGAYCSSGRIIIYIINTGYQSTITQTDLKILSVDDINKLGSLPFAIQTGDSGKILDDDNGGSLWTSGHHTVDIGTVSSIQHISVFCS